MNNAENYDPGVEVEKLRFENTSPIKNSSFKRIIIRKSNYNSLFGARVGSSSNSRYEPRLLYNRVSRQCVSTSPLLR